MAQTGYTPISIYYSATTTNVPTAGNLVAGELAINTADGKLFYKDSAGVVQILASKSSTSGIFTSITNSGLTANRVVYSTTGGLETDSANFIYDTNGQLVIGTTASLLPGGSPTTRGEVTINGSTDSFVVFGIGGVIKGYVGQTSNGLQLDSEGATTITAVTNGTERMRIDSSGRLLVGTTTAQGGSTTVYGSANPLWTNCTAAGASALAVQNSGAAVGSAVSLIAFQVGSGNGTTIGSVTYNGTLTVYATTSDSRVKTDNGIATETSVIDDTVIHDFTWKNGVKDRGVFAQEAYKVKPSAVQVGTDDVDEKGNLTKPWGVDYSVYVPDLIVYCQQLKARIETLEAQLAVK